jgi:hypothetical protein
MKMVTFTSTLIMGTEASEMLGGLFNNDTNYTQR